MGDRNWKLGDDLCKQDNLLDPITFDELILTVHCNCRKITPEKVRECARQIINYKLEDTWFFVENNMEEIIAEAKKGRE